MKKSDLKTGMVIEVHDGRRATVFKDTASEFVDVISGERLWNPLSVYSEDLKESFGHTIVKVYQPQHNNAFGKEFHSELDLIWERDVRTPAQKLGFEVGDLVYDRFNNVYKVEEDTGEDVILVKVVKCRRRTFGEVINRNIRFLTKLEL